MRPGLGAYLVLTQFPGRRFEGKVVRTANAIDLASRTLLTEVDVPNKTGELLPGGYAEVHLEMKAKALAACEVHGAVPSKHWKKDASLMQFLQSL